MGKVITINQATMKYMSTGRFRTHYDKETLNFVLEDWRELFRVLISKGVASIDIDLDYITETYSKIHSFFEDGFFKSGEDILRYFEFLGGIDEEDFTKEISHNAMLYRGCLEVSDLEFLHQREICSIKVTDVLSGKTWGFGGIYEDMKLNRDHFNHYVEGDYILTHGSSLLGLIAIKSLTKKEFDIHVKWFENVHKHTRNPFVKYKKEIESLLRE